MKLLVATTNPGKLAELRTLLGGLELELVSLVDVGLGGSRGEVDEDADAFEGNARKKAVELARRSGLPTLADDSGLEVDALHGAPSVHSARYAGIGATDAANVDKLLAALDGVPPAERTGRFRCVLALASRSGIIEHVTDGRCEGVIATERRGTAGFGYDPVFVPTGETRTMAELDPHEKNARSHRGAAVRSMRAFLAQVRAAQQ